MPIGDSLVISDSSGWSNHCRRSQQKASDFPTNTITAFDTSYNGGTDFGDAFHFTYRLNSTGSAILNIKLHIWRDQSMKAAIQYVADANGGQQSSPVLLER